MKHYSRILICLFFFGIYISPTFAVAQTINPVGQTGGKWDLLFNDEFNGSAVDLTRWRPNWLGPNDTATSKPINSAEVSCYDPQQTTVANGELTFTAVARPCNGYSYASGLVESNGKFNFTYGYMEAGIWLNGNGSSIYNWPAFWADGTGKWPVTGEIDVMEGLDGRASWHFHYPGGGPGGYPSGTYTNGWHIFAADWEPGVITFYYDGREVGKQTAGVTDQPMYLILNYGLKSNIAVPSTMKVDYVRFWGSSNTSITNLPGAPVIPITPGVLITPDPLLSPEILPTTYLSPTPTIPPSDYYFPEVYFLLIAGGITVLLFSLVR
jgi:beta-glucanase (GH16 family)